MRKTFRLLAAAVLLTTAACARTDPLTGPERGPARRAGDGTPPDTTATVQGGNGYLGSGG
jgi:predicted small lipoprotein YifL